jgi:hypothetical protein
LCCLFIYGFCPGGHLPVGLLLQPCVCPWPGLAELPGQVDPITTPLWLVQLPGVILADALFINPGATATNANVAATIANNAIVFVLVCIDIQ